MKKTNTIQLKSDLYNLIDKVNDIDILNIVKIILSGESSTDDFWEELPPTVQDSIKTAIKQAQNGETKDHDQIIKKYEQWL